MAKTNLIAGLDLGSGRVTCLIGEPDSDTSGMKILGGASVPCRGVKGGVVINVPEASRAIRDAVERAEADASATVSGIYLGVRGSHLESFNNHGAFNISRTDKEITSEDVNAVLENAKAIPIATDREILHVIPQGYSLDRQRGVPDPAGMEGSLLEVDVHIITASSSHLNNLTKAVADAGFEVYDSVYSLLALGEFLVSPEERELGSLLVDLGGQSVSLAIFSEGGIKFSRELAIGSDFITRDLAIGLHTNMHHAERIKIEHGVAHPRLANGGAEKEISFLGVDGRTQHQIKTSTMMNIIVPRVEEIFTLVSEEVQKSSFADVVVPGGAVLAGGGARLKGIPEAAEQILGMPVRLGLPHAGLISAPERLLDATYASALALVAYSRAASYSPEHQRPGPRWVRRFKSFVKDLF